MCFQPNLFQEKILSSNIYKRAHFLKSKSEYLLTVTIFRSFLICKWRRQWQPTPVRLPGKSHGWKSLVGYSPWGREELDTTERLHFLFSLPWVGEGNGNPLQCSCLEYPRDRGAWWAAVYGVAQSQTRLKRQQQQQQKSQSLLRKLCRSCACHFHLKFSASILFIWPWYFNMASIFLYKFIW